MNVDEEIRATIIRLWMNIDRRVAEALAKQRAKNPKRFVGQWGRRVTK